MRSDGNGIQGNESVGAILKFDFEITLIHTYPMKYIHRTISTKTFELAKQLTEFLKARFNNGRKSNLYFYRDAKDNEVDLICDSPDMLSAIEIKSSQTPSTEFTKGINSFKNTVKTGNVHGYVYYTGNESLVYKDIKYIPWSEYSRGGVGQ